MNEKSKLYVLIDGLNIKRRWFTIIYFSQYFMFRILICILLGLSFLVSSLALWIVFVVFQVINTLTTFLPIYQDIKVRFVSFLGEVLLLIFGAYSLACQIKSDNNDAT